MGKIGVWKIRPVKNEIILTLINYKGEMLDKELLRSLKKEYVDMTKYELNKVLFQLEVENIITVQRVRKHTNRIALKRNAPIDKELLQNLSDSINGK